MKIIENIKKIILVTFILIITFNTCATNADTSLDNDLSTLYKFKNRHHDFWHNLSKQFNWKVTVDDKKIAFFREQYLSNKKSLYDRLARARPYLYIILEEIRNRNLPAELILLPMVESNFDPFAYSQANAVGIWQITPPTAKEQNISNNWWYDGRRDINESTDAALGYLQNLHKYLGNNWLYTVAAYNSGAGNVHNAITRNNNKSLPTDFWSLELPQETQDYVPKLLALIDIIKNNKKYDMPLPELADWPIVTKVNLDSQIDMAIVANILKLNLETVYRLNPGYNRWATATENQYHLLIPIDSVEKLGEEIEKIPADQRVRFSRYIVQKGDSLIKIAKDFNTNAEVIKSLNSLSNNTVILDTQLLIPIASQDINLYKKTAKETINDSKLMAAFKKTMPQKREIIRKIYYQIHKGESVGSLAVKFNVRSTDIINWNKLNQSKKLQPGDTLTIFINVTDIAKLDSI